MVNNEFPLLMIPVYLTIQKILITFVIFVNFIQITCIARCTRYKLDMVIKLVAHVGVFFFSSENPMSLPTSTLCNKIYY